MSKLNFDEWLSTKSQEEQDEYNNARFRYFMYCKLPCRGSELKELRAKADQYIIAYYKEKFKQEKYNYNNEDNYMQGVSDFAKLLLKQEVIDKSVVRRLLLQVVNNE